MPSVTRSGTVFTTAEGSGVSWTDPANAASSNNTYATATLGEGQGTRRLKATGFGFDSGGDAVPEGATVTGIVMGVERKANAGGGVDTGGAWLVKGGTTQVGGGQGKNGGGVLWTTVDVTETFGTSVDLWGNTWTAADVRGAGFGCGIVANSGGDGYVASIDHVTLTVHYTAAPAGGGSRLSILGVGG